jgi:predicted nucleic acid-binding protein
LDLLSAGAEAVAAAIWPFEVENALLVAERRKRISVAQVTALLGRILHPPVSVENVEPDVAFTRVLSVARHQKLTEYDAGYVELALRNGLPLATLDDPAAASCSDIRHCLTVRLAIWHEAKDRLEMKPFKHTSISRILRY